MKFIILATLIAAAAAQSFSLSTLRNNCDNKCHAYNQNIPDVAIYNSKRCHRETGYDYGCPDCLCYSTINGYGVAVACDRRTYTGTGSCFYWTDYGNGRRNSTFQVDVDEEKKRDTEEKEAKEDSELCLFPDAECGGSGEDLICPRDQEAGECNTGVSGWYIAGKLCITPVWSCFNDRSGCCEWSGIPMPTPNPTSNPTPNPVSSGPSPGDMCKRDEEEDERELRVNCY